MKITDNPAAIEEPTIHTSHLPDFQQAKKSRKRAQFLQIVAKPDRATRGKPKAKSEPKLTRVAFRVSRLMEFCTKRELQNQTGHSAYDWPLVVLKELMDNALDACEEAEVAPVHLDRRRGRDRSPSRTTAAASRPKPSSRSSTTRSGCPAAKLTCRRPAARRATRSRPSSPWATCSIASARTAITRRWE